MEEEIVCLRAQFESVMRFAGVVKELKAHRTEME